MVLTGKQKQVYRYILKLESEGTAVTASRLAIYYNISLRNMINILKKLEDKNCISRDNFIYKSKKQEK